VLQNLSRGCLQNSSESFAENVAASFHQSVLHKKKPRRSGERGAKLSSLLLPG